MPASKRWLSVAIRILRIGAFTLLGITGVVLLLVFIHRGLLPIVAWFCPQLENVFYDLAVFGPYRTRQFVSFDLEPPRGILRTWDDTCDTGDVFLAPNGKSVDRNGPVLLDSQGELIWMSNDFDTATNFRIQHYRGEDYLTFWAGHKHGSLGAGATFMLDSKYNIAHRVHAVGEGLEADLHEFQLTNDGTALITVYNVTTMDLRPMGWGRPEEGWIEDCILQEIDIETKELLFQWRASDHYNAEDSYYWHPFGGYVESIPFDYFHMNSIEKDSKGNYLTSSRHFHTVTYINGSSGDIIWRLGGGADINDFTDLSDGLATSHQWQHHARWVSEEEGILTLLDNGIAGPLHVDAPYSKGLLLQVNPENMTAKHLQSYVSSGKAKASSQGSVVLLPNNHLLVGWGSSAAWSEFAMDGTLLCEAHFAASWSFWWERAKNYRVFKSHGWVGTPEYPPTAKIKGSELYVSWNGATEVKFWELQGAKAKSKSGGQAFDSIDVAEKRGFETFFTLPPSGDYVRYRVVALDSEKKTLHFSDPVEPDTGSGSIVGVVFGVFACIGAFGGVWYLARICARRRRPGQKFFGWEQYQYSKL